MAALQIRRGRTPEVLRKQAKSETDKRVARRILAIANALDGMSRDDVNGTLNLTRVCLGRQLEPDPPAHGVSVPASGNTDA